MKIITVRFQNLNSLRGEWEIDFTHPEYSRDGIFAITGPTGSGKTTILDAICLALYGRTPRLNWVTKSTNEIMSRTTGRCFAEVCFETPSGRYLCQWSQHRARNKPKGELQVPRHELSNADSGEIIGSSLREVVEKIELLTGMDYERFTRSMLLAQGGFAAFLKAPPNERAPILEQITGTEIYSRISIKVHEQKNKEAKKLEDLQDSVAGIRLLTEEERQKIRSRLTDNLGLESQQLQKRDALRKALLWLENISRLKQELNELQEKEQLLEEQIELFRPAAEKLVKARHAKELAGDYARLSSKREQQEEELNELKDHQNRLPESEDNLRISLNSLQTAQSSWDDLQVKHKKELAIIKAVRELDYEIKQKQLQVRDLTEAINAAKGDLKASDERMLSLEIIMGQNQKKLEEVKQYLEINRVDSGLLENLAAIEQIFRNLQGIDLQQCDAQQRLAELSSEIAVGDQELEQLDSIYKQVLLQSEQSAQSLESIQRARDSHLKGLELEDWRDKLEADRDRQSLLEKLKVGQQSLNNLRTSLQENTDKQATLAQGQSLLIEKIRWEEARQLHLEREAGHLETQLDLLKRIQSLSEQRDTLKDGQPCPLCGSIQHPYAQGNVPVPQETELSLRKAREGLKRSNQDLSDLSIKLTENKKDLQQLCQNEEKLNGLLEKECAVSADCLDELGISVTDLDWADIIVAEASRVQVQISEYEDLIQRVEQKNKLERQALKDLEKAQRSLTVARDDYEQCRHNLEIIKSSHRFTLEQVEVLQRQSRKGLENAHNLVGPYGIVDLTSSNFDTYLDLLTRRRDQWQEKLAEKEAQEKTIRKTEIDLIKEKEQNRLLATKLPSQQDKHKTAAEELNQLHLQRQSLYSDKDPDDEEKRLLGDLETAQKELEKASDGQRTAEQELKHLREKIATGSRSTQRRVAELVQMEKVWQFRLHKLGFADETDYLGSCLAEEEYIHLQKTNDVLKEEQLRNSTLIQDKTISLSNEQEKKITEQPQVELQQDMVSCETDIKNIQLENGALNGQLREDEQARQKQGKIFKDIEMQKKELVRWSALHELIGSADGKKYRNFAQGLTFQNMIAYANQQLTKMTDRYLLIADSDVPLGLNVIDKYQADEVRSTKNLSGGESFIVSLALALGLSRMASHNVRIDSLFLDEGFGSLDEYALDTALETLSGLYQDSQLIGLISHVPALKERISTQIQVIPQTGGRSIIEGPGCRSGHR